MSSMQAQQGSKYTKIDTADAAATSTSGRLVSVTIMPTGAVTPTVTVFDNTAASGTILFGPLKIASGVPFHAGFSDEGINVTTGVFVHADSWTTLAVGVTTKR